MIKIEMNKKEKKILIKFNLHDFFSFLLIIINGNDRIPRRINTLYLGIATADRILFIRSWSIVYED
jgi:hypothetical protein